MDAGVASVQADSRLLSPSPALCSHSESSERAAAPSSSRSRRCGRVLYPHSPRFRPSHTPSLNCPETPTLRPQLRPAPLGRVGNNRPPANPFHRIFPARGGRDHARAASIPARACGLRLRWHRPRRGRARSRPVRQVCDTRAPRVRRPTRHGRAHRRVLAEDISFSQPPVCLLPPIGPPRASVSARPVRRGHWPMARPCSIPQTSTARDALAAPGMCAWAVFVQRSA